MRSIAIYSDEQPQLALLGADLGDVRRTPWFDVDVEVADRVGLEALLAWSFGVGKGQAGDAVALQAAVQAGAGQGPDAGLKGVEAFVER